jgi:hypothetical protein
VTQESDHVLWRITVEYGRRYVYLTLTDAAGKIVKDREEVFTQPFLLDRKDASDEATDAWDVLYDHCNDTIVFPLQDLGDGKAQSGEED